MRALPVLAVLLGGAALSAQTAPQAPTQPEAQRAPGTFRASATAVVLDVVVRDGRNRPVVDLGFRDFEIYEDGVRQALGSFSAPAATIDQPPPVEAAGAPAAALPANTAVDAGQAGHTSREPSVMAFLFDRLTLEGRKPAVDAVRRYVGEGAQTSHIIGVLDVDSGLAMLQPFTRDAEAVRESLKKIRATRPGRSDAMGVTDLRGPMEQGLAGGPTGGRPADDLTIAVEGLLESTVELEAGATGRQSLDALAAVIAGLGRAPGRKSLVIFSEGIGPTAAILDGLIDQANRANVAMYTVDVAGLRTVSHTFLAGRYSAAYTGDGKEDAAGTVRAPDAVAAFAKGGSDVPLRMLARETGGQFIGDTNDLSRAFVRLEEDLRSYYTLTYASPRVDADWKFHRIEVKVKRPGLTARSRSGYMSVPSTTGTLPVLAYEAPALARLDARPVPNELPAMARAFVFPVSSHTARVPVMVSLTSGALDYARDEAAGTFTAEAIVLIRLRDAHGFVVHKASEKYTMTGPLANLEESRRRELLFYRQPRLTPGVYTLEAIAQDARTGKSGVRISTLEVPAATPGSLRIGTPFLVQRAEPAPLDRDVNNPLYFGNVLLYPNLGQPLASGARELTFGFSVYAGPGASADASVEVLRSGQPLASAPISLGAADAQGRINQLSTLALDPLAPGAYELRVTVKAGGQQVTRGVRFAVAGN